MQFVFLGLIVLWLLVLLGRGTIRANPAMLAGLIRNGGGVLSLVAVALAVVRGQMAFGAGLLFFAVWLFTGAKKPDFSSFGLGGKAGSTGASQATSSWVEMQVDHASGEITGRVLKGTFSGRTLADLGEADCVALYKECRAGDTQGARLLETYFDRRFPGWRAAAQGNADAGQGRRGAGGGMTEQQAYEILGIEQGASPAQITGAHRTLMKKCHPDHGGTAQAAASVNQARDILMRRHRMDS